jgi:hypothetical protein
MIFPVNIVNHATPALAVTVENAGVPAVTYNQIKQSLGSQVYRVDGMYIYSTNMSQLMGAIQYQIYDASGNQNINSIVTVVNPYAGNATAINVDLTKYEQDFIFNGNSSLAATILANTLVRIQFYTNRITNSDIVDVAVPPVIDGVTPVAPAAEEAATPTEINPFIVLIAAFILGAYLYKKE